MKNALNNFFCRSANIFSTGNIVKTIIIILLIGTANLYSQIVDDFTIADSGTVPSIYPDLNGGIFVSWQKLKDAIYLKHIGADGSTIGNEIKFYNTFASVSPQIAVSNNKTIVVWEDRLSNIVSYFKTYIMGNVSPFNILDTNNYVMFNNNPATNAVRVLPTINFLNDTTFLVTWSGNGDSNIVQYGVYGQIGTISGNKVGDNFLMSDHTSDSTDAFYSKIIYKKQNNYFYVTWEDNSSGRYNIYGRKFNLNGVPIGSSFLISDDSTMTYMYYYSVAMDTAGNFVVVWFADKGKKSQMEWRWYNNDGSPSTNVEQLTPLDSIFSSASTIDVSINKNGEAIIEWEQFDSNYIKIFGQRFHADRSKLGSPFRVATNNTSNDEIYANVVLSNDTIFSVWQEGNGIEGNILDFNNITSVNKNDLNRNQAASYTLLQNYPNPFNPSTTIQYKIPNSGLVTIKVYDVLGSKVKTLVNQYQNMGSHEINFNADNLSSGVYFYQLKVGNFISTKKMLLLK